jgi:hypothetical protein
VGRGRCRAAWLVWQRKKRGARRGWHAARAWSVGVSTELSYGHGHGCVREGAGREGELELECLLIGQQTTVEEIGVLRSTEARRERERVVRRARSWARLRWWQEGRWQRPCEAWPTVAERCIDKWERLHEWGSEGVGRSWGGTRMDSSTLA